MLRGYRGIFLALVGLTLAAAPAPNRDADPKAAQAAEKIERSLESVLDPQARQSDTGEYQAPCRVGEYNNQSDLCAHWYAARAARDAADWAYWAVFWSVASLALSSLGLIALLVTIRQGREANAIAREGDRAWLRLEAGPAAELWIRPEGMQFKTDIILQNYGNSPALDVWSEGIVHFARPERADLLKKIEDRQPSEKDGHTILFPGTPEGGGLECEHFDPLPESGTGIVFASIFTKYKIVGSDAWHYTAFTYVTKPDDAATRFYGMVGDELRLNYGQTHQRINLTLHKGQGGLPIAT